MNSDLERLKNYWQTPALVFIAIFKKISNNQGYFNQFINPISKRKIFYPEFEGIEVADKRVSFSYNKVANLKDGDYFKVELSYTEKPKGKNNPYSLEIKNVIALDQAEINRLFNEIKKDDSENEIYYGCYKKVSDVFACFENVMFSESGKMLVNDGESQNVFVSPKLELKAGNYYSFSIKEIEGKLPNALPKSIQELSINPYKDYVRLRFERLNNPEANKMIANLMREIGKGMYSSKQRMIFELLQNADDAPGKEKVEFHIDINGPYFFVMHDGAPFNKDDVEAITSAAESTKRGDNKKTGYKGIGFKSVFTDSTEVWIKSGGYQFAFQRNNDLFNDFDKFYFSSERYKKYPELLEEDKLKYRNQRLRFNGSTDIPWQVIPLWHDHLPAEFSDSNFNNFNNPVQFALKIGEYNIEEYKSAIDNITKRPQFLLFLRNTSKFRSPKNGVTVLRKDTNQVIEIVKTQRGEDDKQVYYYTKQVFENIDVSDEAFSKLNIGLKKQSKINDYNEVTYYFTDLDGREIETIPPKLASASETEISFGISLVNSKISPERQYLEGLPKYSSLFTYLPMEDTRFQLPFLVNADFVPSSDRQKIQGDNLWNKYVMIKVAEKHVATLSYFANEFVKDNETYNSYLSLLLKNILPEDDTAQQIIDSYNEKYLEQLNTEPIIVNDLGELQLLSQTIIDASGLTNLIGHELFYEIIKTDKLLPHPGLDASFLNKYEYLEVEAIDLEELASHITPELCLKLGTLIQSSSIYDKPELLSWLNKLAVYIPDNFGKIPFITHNKSLYSIESLSAIKDAWIINKNTSEYESLLKDMGYHVINLQLEMYANINNYLNSISSYINDKSLAYERLASIEQLAKLEPSIKIRLIEFFQKSEFMIGIGKTKYFEELKLFVDENGTSRPLSHLLSPVGISELSSLHQFFIDKNEYKALTESLKKELIQKDKVFSSFVLNKLLFDEWSLQFTSQNISIYVQAINLIYNWKNEAEEILQSQWASIPWLYIDDSTRFTGSDKVFWSIAFKDMPADKYETIKSVLHTSKLKTLPFNECGALVNTFELKTDNVLITDWSVIKNLDTLSANILLDWMENDGTYNSFFEEYTFVQSIENNWSVTPVVNTQIYDGSESSLKEYINSIPLLQSKFTKLDEALCSDNRDKIGLLQGDKLLKAIIETKLYDQELTTRLPQNMTWKLLDSFILNLSAFNLETDKEYNLNSPEHIILYSIIKSIEDINVIPEAIQNTIDCLRSKIIINKQAISTFDLSDLVQFGKGEERKILKLSDVLSEFKGESDVLDNLIESFTGIKEKAKLRKLIFTTRRMQFEEIHKKIEAESSTFYSVHQVVFKLLYEKYFGKKQWLKIHFDKYWKDLNNDEQLQQGYKLFLDIIIDLDFSELTGFAFIDLQLKNCVDKNWAIESEILPQWLESWCAIDQEKRLAFIAKLGYNNINSPIVKLRQATVIDNYDIKPVIRYFEEVKPNTQIIWNTIEWLIGYSTQKITNNITLIKEINNYITLNTTNLEAVTIPIIESITKDGIRGYKLKSISITSKLFVIEDTEEFSHSIYKVLSKESEQMIFIDSSCGKLASHFKSEVVKLIPSVDTELLLSESKLWEEPFYVKWEQYLKYPIYIYKGNEVPYKQVFNNITINKFTSDLKVENMGNYFVSSILKNDILNNLPLTFPKDALASLKEWHYKTLQNETLLDENSFEYKENIDRLLQDRLGISPEDQKRESGNAKTHAVYFLDEQGYNVSSVKNQGAALSNIIDPNGNEVNCIIRSAKGGLLYLDKEHWDMLENIHTHLVVIYPGNNPRLFKDRMELLKEELAENVLFRVPNNKNTSEIDGVFDALESDSHIILVTSEKMKENLFSKLKKKSNVIENDVAVADDNFTI